VHLHDSGLTSNLQLALTHFCEAHGPKSVLCTQILPIDCAQCRPPALSASSSSDSLSTQLQESSLESSQILPPVPVLRKTDTNGTLPTDFSGATTNVGSETEPDSPTIEKHPLYLSTDQKQLLDSQWQYGRNQGDTCISCSFSVPKQVAEKLPAGAPGSRRSDPGYANRGAPVLRSREFVCLRERRRRRSSMLSAFDSKPSSYESSAASSVASSRHPENCHDHALTYLTAKSPVDPDSYAQLRASVIRTLSCELLPRGNSEGPFCFGDSNIGYTIAYVFRLPDPKARGRKRRYAFLALAGKDASRAFQACPPLWESFKRMARGIETAAQRNQDKQRQKEEEAAAALEAGKNGTRAYTPVSSFLNTRATDPDGHARRAGHTVPRSLAEIVGDDNIFTFLHQYFVAILRGLGDQFGGTPLVDPAAITTTSEPEESTCVSRAKSGHGQQDDNRCNKAANDEPAAPQDQPQMTSLKPSSEKTRSNAAAFNVEDVDIAKAQARRKLREKNKNTPTTISTIPNETLKRLNPQCAVPMTVNETAQRQVVV
jgi:hypothetical protein